MKMIDECHLEAKDKREISSEGNKKISLSPEARRNDRLQSCVLILESECSKKIRKAAMPTDVRNESLRNSACTQRSLRLKNLNAKDAKETRRTQRRKFTVAVCSNQSPTTCSLQLMACSL